MNISKSRNKFLLTIIACAAVNQIIVAGPEVKQGTEKKGGDGVVAKSNQLIYEEAKQATKKAKELHEITVKKKAEYIKKLDEDKISQEARKADSTLTKLEEDDILAIKELTAAENAEKSAWEQASPWLASGLKFTTLFIAGGWFSNKLGLNGNSATAFKYVYGTAVSLVVVFAAIKAYNYLFEDEVEDDEDAF